MNDITLFLFKDMVEKNNINEKLPDLDKNIPNYDKKENKQIELENMLNKEVNQKAEIENENEKNRYLNQFLL
jgi:hypothetical protein